MFQGWNNSNKHICLEHRFHKKFELLPVINFQRAPTYEHIIQHIFWVSSFCQKMFHELFGLIYRRRHHQHFREFFKHVKIDFFFFVLMSSSLSFTQFQNTIFKIVPPSLLYLNSLFFHFQVSAFHQSCRKQFPEKKKKREKKKVGEKCWIFKKQNSEYRLSARKIRFG